MLFEIETNKIPPGAKAGVTQTPDGISLRHASWKSLVAPVKGTVILLQGRAEFIEKQFETVGDLRKNGFDVIAFDWRGQGGSSRMLKDRRRGYVDSFDQYVLDLETIINEVALPDCRAPHYILAHSTGSLVALLAALQIRNRIQRMVLASPFVSFGKIGLPPGAVLGVAGFLSMIGLGEVYMSGGPDLMFTRRFSGNVLTSDTRRFERNAAIVRENPELAIGGPTAAWLFAAGKAMEKLREPDFIGAIAIPTLMVLAGNDRIVENQAADDLAYRMRSGRALTIDGARHELLQETDVFREQLLAAFLTFIPGEPSRISPIS